MPFGLVDGLFGQFPHLGRYFQFRFHHLGFPFSADWDE
jgi:hypothetical protein